VEKNVILEESFFKPAQLDRDSGLNPLERSPKSVLDRKKIPRSGMTGWLSRNNRGITVA
jgi:hypothetical protein